jgi:PAS domain S-box-containing protein
MPKLFPRSFFWQLVLGTVLVQTAFLALFSWYTVVTQRRVADRRSSQRMSQQLVWLAQACAGPLERKDDAALSDVLQLSRITPTIQVARLTDLQGKTLAVSDNGRNQGLDAYERAALPTATHEQVFRTRNGDPEAVAPVLEHGTPVALLWLEPNHTVTTSNASLVIRIMMTYGGLALLANLLPIFIIVRTVTRPLRTLRRATDGVVSHPHLEAGFPLPVTTTNEAGELTASFNSMVRQLREQRTGLLDTLALLDSMLSNAPIGFAFVDRDLRYVRVNDFLASIHGLPVEQYVGRTPEEIYTSPAGPAKMACLREVFDTGEPMRNVEFAGELLHAPGARHNWMMQFYPVRTREDTVRWVGIIVVDITEQLRSEEALRRTEKLAATGRLAASIAHEINNPLEAVTNLLYLLSTHRTLDDVAMQFVATAQSELARVSAITQQTLRFYRQTSSPTTTNLAEVLDSIVQLYQPRIASVNATIRQRYRGNLDIFGFSGEVRQLFANLLGNALDAMPKGGSVELRAWRGSGPDGSGGWSHGVRVVVADNGSGMSEATRARIFEAFFTTKEATGTGLGLWVSEEIIRKHRGSVRVRSRQAAPSGTCFLLFFPDAASAADGI